MSCFQKRLLYHGLAGRPAWRQRDVRSKRRRRVAPRDSGEAIGASSGVRAGTGTLIVGDNIIATKVGWVKENNGVTSVDPIHSSLHA